MTLYDNFKKATLTAVVAAALSLGFSLPASASMIGDTITITTSANIPVDTWTDSVSSRSPAYICRIFVIFCGKHFHGAVWLCRHQSLQAGP